MKNVVTSVLITSVLGVGTFFGVNHWKNSQPTEIIPVQEEVGSAFQPAFCPLNEDLKNLGVMHLDGKCIDFKSYVKDNDSLVFWVESDHVKRAGGSYYISQLEGYKRLPSNGGSYSKVIITKDEFRVEALASDHIFSTNKITDYYDAKIDTIVFKDKLK